MPPVDSSEAGDTIIDELEATKRGIHRIRDEEFQFAVLVEIYDFSDKGGGVPVNISSYAANAKVRAVIGQRQQAEQHFLETRVLKDIPSNATIIALQCCHPSEDIKEEIAGCLSRLDLGYLMQIDLMEGSGPGTFAG